MKCPHCNKRHPNYFKFCPQFGLPIQASFPSFKGDRHYVMLKFSGDVRSHIIQELIKTGYDEQTATKAIDNLMFLCRVSEHQEALDFVRFLNKIGVPAIATEL